MTPLGALIWKPVPVRDLSNGTYHAEYAVKRAGGYLVRVMLGGVHVMGSPFQVMVMRTHHDDDQLMMEL